MKFSLVAVLAAAANTAFAFPGFDAAKQCFDFTHGEHKFVAPGPGDLRGVCPGLNSMANHGYIPHNGIATYQQLVNASTDLFGTDTDISHLLAAYGVSLSGSGDVDHMSIGGPPGDRAPITEELLRPVFGLSSTHNNFESDASPMRGDLYEKYLSPQKHHHQINLLTNHRNSNGIPDGKVNYSLPILAEMRAERMNQSIANNKDVFFSPFSGTIVQTAAHSFIFQLFANRTEKSPEGILDRKTLKTAYAMETPGHERLPDYWCKRGENLNIAQFNIDNLPTFKKYPDLLHKVVGGNEGAVNTFKSVNLAQLTNGTFPNFEFLLQDNNYACLGLFQAVYHAPLFLEKMYANITKANGLISEQVPLFAYLNCPKVAPFGDELFKQYPGWNRSFTWDEWKT
ncbi:Cloroperoxidase [Tothia fuscella]|uniref:Cloroperoxidase n=1 Tax=Tothia fuscella TaxID=1048955 RepID=A0A9P4NI91_9PEZI|nr:Cloroperoxidase [Tothia fuscella]